VASLIPSAKAKNNGGHKEPLKREYEALYLSQNGRSFFSSREWCITLSKLTVSLIKSPQIRLIIN